MDGIRLLAWLSMACLVLGLLGSVCIIIQAVGYWLPSGNMICSERKRKKVDMNEKFWLVYLWSHYDAAVG